MGWLYKKYLSADISNPAIDESYEASRNAGAAGGKLLGAGGEDFFFSST
ncbi:GHMP kinases C terminal [Brevinema andersonii]|uniref:GHMP kinases C terminal n=1 Tax=Brevinema andersonii TaxID=34097 RepID=A0A1I1D1E4_BREAD|nr:GHMP kinases C terminal [Brevinema andersonii]